MTVLEPTDITQGETEQLGTIDQLLEQFHHWANLWDRLASSHEQEERKLRNVAIASGGLRSALNRAWTTAADSQAEFASDCRAESNRWRDAARAVRASFARRDRRSA